VPARPGPRPSGGSWDDERREIGVCRRPVDADVRVGGKES